MVKMKWRINYYVNSGMSKPCCARIHIYLPVAKDGVTLHPLVKNPEVTVFGYSLREYWGSLTEDEKFRVESVYVNAENWDEVRELAHSELQQAVEKIRDVVKRNLELVATTPANEEGEIDLMSIK